MDTQNKLPVAGETKIAQLFLYDEKSRQTLDCTLYYGNVLEPVINGRVMHLKDEAQYEHILSAFFNEEQLDDELIRIEEGGRQYAIPSRWELKRASFEMMNRESAIELEKERQERAAEADVKEDGAPIKEEADISPPSPPAAATVTYTADAETLAKLNEIVEKLPGNEKRVRRMKRLTAVMALITFVALAVSGYLYYLSTVTVPEDITYIKVNGVTYEVPLANVTIEEGEKKILVYGFTVTKKNGEPVYEAMPLGEFDLANEEKPQIKE